MRRPVIADESDSDSNSAEVFNNILSEMGLSMPAIATGTQEQKSEILPDLSQAAT
jgi:hypothetical protein